MGYKCKINGLLVCKRKNPTKERCLSCTEFDKCEKTHEVLWFCESGGPVRKFACTSLLEAELVEKEFKGLGYKTEIKKRR